METPSAVQRTWWPATVRLPDVPQPVMNVKVFATPQGLVVYNRAQTSMFGLGEPLFASPIDYDKTPEPPRGYAEFNAGAVIHTEAGVVSVVKQHGCGCSYRALKAWTPSWTAREVAWGKVV